MYTHPYTCCRMLKWAGWGVAMANAETTEVIAAADEVTLSNVEEGVALQLEKMLAAKAMV